MTKRPIDANIQRVYLPGLNIQRVYLLGFRTEFQHTRDQKIVMTIVVRQKQPVQTMQRT